MTVLIEEEPNLVVELRHEEFFAGIADTGEGFRLGWHDYVVNEWNEVYPTLGAALGRLGMLVAAVEAETGFMQADPAGWHAQWVRFTEAWAALTLTSIDPPYEPSRTEPT